MLRALGRFPLAPILFTKLCIIASVLAGSLAIGWLAARLGQPEMLLGVIALPLMCVALFSQRKLEYGVLAIVLTAAVVRFSLSTGTQSRIVMSLVVTGGVVAWWLVQMLISKKGPWLKPVRTNKPLLGFMAVCVISFIWSSAFRDALVVVWSSFPMVQVAALIVMLLLPAAFLLASNIIQDLKWLKALWVIFLALGAVGVLSDLLRLPTVRVINVGGVFPLWIVSLTYPQAMFNRELRHWQRAGLLALCGLWLYRQLVLGILWLSGWGPAMGAIAVTTFLRSRRLFLALLLVAVVFVGLRFDYFYQRIYVESIAEGDLQRLELWRTNLEHVESHPLFGTGPAGYAVYYMTYHPENARSTHNNYFDIIAQTGIVGTFFFLWFAIALGWTALELCKRLEHTHGFEAAFACGMAGGVAGALASMMLGDWIIPFAYNQTIEGFDNAVYAWVLMGAMVGLYHMVNARPSLPGAAQAGEANVSES